jgi:hypothetical protein
MLPNVHHGKRDANFLLYEIDNMQILPHINPAAASVLVKGAPERMFDVITSDNFTIGNNALFISTQISESQREFWREHSEVQSKYTFTITFQKIYPRDMKSKWIKLPRHFSSFFRELSSTVEGLSREQALRV